MMKKFIFLTAVLGLLAAFPAFAASAPVLSSLRPHQGDTVILSLPVGVRVATSTFDGRGVPFFRYGQGQRALIPLSASATAGKHQLYIKYAAPRGAYTRTLTVLSRKFPEVKLGVPAQINESPEAVVQGFGDINAELASIVNVWQPTALFKKSFGMPLKSWTGFGSPFGELRQTGQSWVRHLGTDFTAPIGAPVMSINDGVVSLATSTTLYGNTMVVDHGAGIYSLYLHLSRMDKAPGTPVKKGEVIGAVGDTGYAFAAHLHLSIKVDGVSVDPVSFIKSFR